MHIIAGQYKGRKIKTVAGLASRPTLGRVRESLFDILRPRLGEAVFADLYAGTGSIGLEALSQGAQHVTFIESDRTVGKILGDNVGILDPEGKRTRIITAGAVPAVMNLSREVRRFDIVFMDPPYNSAAIADWTEDTQLREMMAPDGLLILQHEKKRKVPSPWAGCRWLRDRSYGKTTLSFYTMGE
ncbi:16S rRNA (guanine(966)-N(2))-methyltransferase RsmD [candidate division FCPU426 bacterium]|nr:16S rRNA (guanine(966)-N(2))-methyltransferase RsmD [candidate division FCPU426 bacterium]